MISGDAAPPSPIAEQCSGCDILIHEGGRPSAEASRYYREFHTTAEELAEVAVAARPKLLVLYHQSGDSSKTLEILRARYDGSIVVARDLDAFPPVQPVRKIEIDFRRHSPPTIGLTDTASLANVDAASRTHSNSDGRGR